MVSGIFCGSVVANMKIIWSGGSSSVFRRALNAEVESIWTSSMIYILCLSLAGRYLAFSRSVRIASTPVCEAPSISWTSIEAPSVISIQDGHLLQGCSVGPSLQLSAFASILAMEVFPTPLSPINRKA